MKIAPFALERYFARHEFTAPYLLSSSDCDGWPLSELLGWADDETRALWAELKLGYTDSRGLPLLRREIASLYEGLSPEQVLVLAPEEAIFVAMNVLLEPGDHVVATYPGYQSLYELGRALGCDVELWEPDEAKGWAFDVDRLEGLLRPRTKLVVVNFPHNPTGALPPAAAFRRVLELARARGARVFSDEMYRGLELDEAERLPAACELDERAVSLAGMSKVYGLAGLRVGWLATRDDELLARLSAFRDYTTICGAAPSELLALVGLRARARVVAAHRRRIERNLRLLDSFFVRHSESFSWVRPRAGTIGLARVRTDAEALCERIVREAGVMLLPSTVYGYGRSHVRLGFGRENMPEALRRLETAL